MCCLVQADGIWSPHQVRSSCIRPCHSIQLCCRGSGSTKSNGGATTVLKTRYYPHVQPLRRHFRLDGHFLRPCNAIKGDHLAPFNGGAAGQASSSKFGSSISSQFPADFSAVMCLSYAFEMFGGMESRRSFKSVKMHFVHFRFYSAVLVYH